MKPRPQTAIARPRWWKGKISQRIACESGMIGPPPSPWKMRAAIKVVRSGAAPEMNELTTKSVAQIRKKRRRPKIPASQPVAGMTIAFAARYEVITHETSSSPADSDPCRCGRMTLVTLVSRICMKATTMTVTVMAHFRVGEIGGASGAGDVIGSSRCARCDAERASGQSVGPSRGAAEERQLLVGRRARRDALECVPERGVADAHFLDGEVRLEHAARRAEALDAEFDVGT